MCISHLRTVRVSTSTFVLFTSRLLLYLTQTRMAFNWCSSQDSLTVKLTKFFHLSSRLYEYNNFDFNDPQARLLPPKYFGDVDIIAIFPILVSGCVMLPPILSWSEVVRKHEARAVVIYWGLLMFLTTSLTLRLIFHWAIPYIFTQVASCIISK